ncbi:hypothetical protein ACFL5O_08750, partial [Myxococcota bacterium]
MDEAFGAKEERIGLSLDLGGRSASWPASGWLQASFRQASGKLQASFRQASGKGICGRLLALVDVLRASPVPPSAGDPGWH